MSDPQRTCCPWHDNTCGQVDVCCDHCPSLRESLPSLYAAAFAGVALLVFFALGLS